MYVFVRRFVPKVLLWEQHIIVLIYAFGGLNKALKANNASS